MNHSIPPRELRRWHAWFDRPWPESKLDQLCAAHQKAFRDYMRALVGQQERSLLREVLNARLKEWNDYLRNPSRHDPRNGGL